MKKLQTKLLRIFGNSVYIQLKEFKGAKYPRLVAQVNLSSNNVYFHLENDWVTNNFTIYPTVNGDGYGFASDHQPNKRQCEWIKNNRLNLHNNRSSIAYKAMSMFNNPQLYK